MHFFFGWPVDFYDVECAAFHFFFLYSLRSPFFRILIVLIFSICFILQNFLAANSQCWWNGPLTAATRALKYAGHVAPGMLLVTAEPCALEVLRGAYARSVLKPPATYVISAVGKSHNANNRQTIAYLKTLPFASSIRINGWCFDENRNDQTTEPNCGACLEKKIPSARYK